MAKTSTTHKSSTPWGAATVIDELSAIILEHGGVVEKYIGDAMFALWELDHFDDAHDREE